MKKILIPVDSFASALKASKRAADIANKYNSEITFIHVIYDSKPSKYDRHGDIIDPEFKKLNEKLEEAEKKIINPVIEELNLEGIKINKKVIPGIAYEEILNEAKVGNYDLIVIGQLNDSKIKRIILGSTTKKVLSSATCPVMVIKV